MAEKKNRIWLKRLCGIAAVLMTAVLCLILNAYRAHHVQPLAQDVLERLDLSKTDKLMIVAHPDDEMIWGGGHLLDGGYLVLCITNGRSKNRTAEFRDAVTKTGNIPLILEYPDKVNFIRDNWNRVRDGIEADLQKVISCKRWSLIVTHNPDGEYGHIHHKMTNELTVQAFEALNPDCPLFFFGKYYKASVLPQYEAKLEQIAADKLQKKQEICRCYESQADVMDKLRHMLPYENWTLYQKET